MSGHDKTVTKDDGVKLTLLLKWSEASQKYRVALEKVLQTWAGKHSCDCKVVKVLKDGEDGKAEVVFTPAPAVAELKQLYGMTLTSKDKKTTVTIVSGLLAPPEVDTQSPKDDLKKVNPARELTEMTQNTSLNNRMNVRDHNVDGGQTKTSSATVLQHDQNHQQEPSRSNSLEAAGKRSFHTVPSDGSFSPSPVAGPRDEQNPQLESSGSSSSDAFPTAAVKPDASSVPADGPIPSTPVSGPHHHVQEQTVEQRSSSSSEAGSTPPDRKIPCSIPVGHFWYLNQIYKKEIDQILEQNGVRMNADVRVTFEGNPEGKEKALSEFTALVQKCSGEAASSLFHLKDVKREDWNNIQKVLEKSKKLLFTVSPDEILVWGPRQDLGVIESSLKVAQKTINTRDSPEEFAFKPQNTSPNIIMNINDPLLNDGLTMEQSQWKLMAVSYEGQVNKIQEKYGVDFKTSPPDQGKVKVKPFYKESGGNTSMESHASRALLKLYQRISTSVLNFTQHLGDTDSPKSMSSTDGSKQGEERATKAPLVSTEV